MSFTVAEDEAEVVRNFLQQRRQGYFDQIKNLFIDNYAPVIVDTINNPPAQLAMQMCYGCEYNRPFEDKRHCCQNGVSGYFVQNASFIVSQLEAPLCDMIWKSFCDAICETDVPRREVINWFALHRSPELIVEVVKQDMLNWINEKHPTENPVVSIYER